MTGKPFGLRTAGYLIVAKIFVRDMEGSFHLADVTKENDKLTQVSALVCGMGPEAYKGENRDGTARFTTGPWCRVGDWVVIPRHSSFLFNYRGVAMAMFSDDKVMAIIEDPRDITALYVAPKI